MDFKDKELSQRLRVSQILTMNVNEIFKFILGFYLLCRSRSLLPARLYRLLPCNRTFYIHVVVSILKHPVNPVRVFLEKTTPGYCTHCLLKNHKIK